MRKHFLIVALILFELVAISSFTDVTLADGSLPKELSISQVKITGDEILVLHNNTGSNLVLSNFWIQYYNDFNIANSGVSNSSAQLPAVTLQPQQEILLSVGAAANCGQVWVAKLPFSLKDSGGLLQVVGISQTSGVISYKPEDQVSWSAKTTDSTDIRGVSSTAAAQIWYKPVGIWQATATPPGCVAAGSSNTQTTNPSYTLAQASASPPSVVLSASGSSTNSSMPDIDKGLMAPQISELLPNPSPPQTDADGEFIELYNPNSAQFDLSGFSLKSGITTTHIYNFPANQFTLQPHEFRAFYTQQSGASLSNDSGQVSFFDPGGNLLQQTDAYSAAKEGYAWVFADGLWQWTTKPTPNETNIINTPAASTTAKTSTSSARVKAAKNSKPKAVKSAPKTANTFSPSGRSSPQAKNLHPTILAAIGVLAVLYALYEYRHDLANQLYKFRRYREARRAAR